MGRANQRQRQGIAATEAALMLPIFVTLVFAAIETSNAIFLRQSLTLAAYEAASTLSNPGMEVDDAESRCSEVLAARKVSDFELTTNLDLVENPGDVIEIEVSAPASSYRFGPSWFFGDKTISAKVFMTRTF